MLTSRGPYAILAWQVSHLCRAIRKLAAITLPYQTRKPLYRAVRGELPRPFWVADEQGLVSAVETAFMSTSSDPSTAIAYMQPTGEPTQVKSSQVKLS